MEENKKNQSKLNLLLMIIVPVIIVLILLFVFRSKTSVPSEKGQYSIKNDTALTYDQEGVDRIQALTKFRFPLNASDEKIKSSLVKQVNPLAFTENYIIYYDPDSDKFQVNITTIDINTAKNEAVTWFRNQGFSDEAICILPVEFTIDEKDAESLRGLDIIFNPLPPNCQ